MKEKGISAWVIIGIVFISGCVKKDIEQIEVGTVKEEIIPEIGSGKGRIILEFEDMPEEIITRKIADNFLMGVGTTDVKEGCVSLPVLKDLRVNGINYFLPPITWGLIEEKREGSYPWLPWHENFVPWAEETGAVQNGHMLVWLSNSPHMIPEFAFNRPFDEQADWMEAIFRFFHDDKNVIGATWYFVRDDPFMPYAGLLNDDYTRRPIAKRLIKLANEWNPSITHNLKGQKYLDLDPGEYDLIVNQEVFRVSIVEGQAVKIF